MSLLRKFQRTKFSLGPSKQFDQQQAKDTAPSDVSSLGQPGSSALTRFKNRLRLDKQAGSGYFTGASQVDASHGTFYDIAGDNINVEIKDHELLLLDKLPHVKGAGYQSGNHDTCLTGTRREELRRIEDWEADDENKRVYWLNGIAGTGKSTIAKTFAECTSAKERLGASFFCSRDFDNRSDINLIFPTLAYSLACQYPVFKAALIQILNSTPDVGHESLAMQLDCLLVRPLRSTRISTTIVIDALDECKDRQPVSAILWLLGRQIDALPRVKFFITGRPEVPIRSAFRLPLLRPHAEIFVLHEVNPASVDQDIKLYLRTRLSEIAAQRSDCDMNVVWPTEEEISAVATKCSGIFIVASVIVKFIGSINHTPHERLKIIISRPNSTVDEGKSGVDETYDLIFLQSFEDVKKDDTNFFDRLRLVVGSIALAFNPLSCIDLAEILDLTPKSVRSAIRSLHSVLMVPESDSQLLRVCHKSFPDYLTDPTRCTDMRFHIDPSVYHLKLGIRCLALMNIMLKKNICDLPAYAMNSEIKDLRERRKKSIGSGLEYACRSWARHLCFAYRDEGDVRYVIKSLESFFKYNLLLWLEVLSIIGDLGCAVYTLRDVKAWLVEVNVTDTDLSAIVKDSERFALRFFDVIEVSALHIYHSALPWCPRTSLVRKIYQDDIPKDVNLFNSVENSWDACTRTVETNWRVKGITYSHRDDLIAVCAYDLVGIFEVSTGQCRATLTRDANAPRSVAFSIDDTLIATGCDSGIIDVWDLQTGSLVCALIGHTDRVETVAFSPCDTMIASGSDHIVRIWDVSSHGCKCVLKGHSSDVLRICWLGAGHKVVSGSRDRTVKVWDTVGMLCLKTLRHDKEVISVACSPDSSWIASGTSDGTVKIFDAKTYDIFETISTNHSIISIRFSTRQQLMYTTDKSMFGIWDLTEEANVLSFKYHGYGEAIASDGKSIASRNVDGKVFQLWQTDITNGRDDLNKDGHRGAVHCVAFSGNGHLIASGSWDHTVKLWDAPTGLCLHTFHGHSGLVSVVTFSPDSRFCASASRDHTIRIWNVHTLTLNSTLDTDSTVLITLSPNGSQLLSLQRPFIGPGHLTLWEVESSSLLAKMEVVDHFSDCAFGVDGASVILQNCHSVEKWRIPPSPSVRPPDDVDSSDVIGSGVGWRISPASPSDHCNLPTNDKNNRLSLPMVFVPIHGEQERYAQALAIHQYSYEKKNGWILDGQGRRVLWMPPSLRGYANDCLGKKIIVGSAMGKVTVVDFLDEQSESPD